MPKLILDSQRAKKNIQSMAQKAVEYKVKFRPHFKTHQSLDIGQWFREYPIDGITVSSVSMAEYFKSDGWDSITIAFPINVNDSKRINELASDIDIRVLCVSRESLILAEPSINSEVGIYIELDPSYGRSGIDMNNEVEISSLIDFIHGSPVYRFEGFYIHAGHSYKNRGKSELISFADDLLQKIDRFKNSYPYPICYGDTPTCSVITDFKSIDQISPGNFVFYDWIQTKIGSCTASQIAIAMECDVVAKYEGRNEVLIHGGAVHFSKDYDTQFSNNPYFGQIINDDWSPIEGVTLKSVSQEHGIISCTTEYFNNLRLGDRIKIFPIHSCLTADLMGHYFTRDNQRLSHISSNYK